MELRLQMLDSHDGILRTSKLVNGTKITISLNKLDNSDNLRDSKMWVLAQTTTFLPLLWHTNAVDEN